MKPRTLTGSERRDELLTELSSANMKETLVQMKTLSRETLTSPHWKLGKNSQERIFSLLLRMSNFFSIDIYYWPLLNTKCWGRGMLDWPTMARRREMPTFVKPYSIELTALSPVVLADAVQEDCVSLATFCSHSLCIHNCCIKDFKECSTLLWTCYLWIYKITFKTGIIHLHNLWSTVWREYYLLFILKQSSSNFKCL